MTGLVASPTHPRESLDASANATVGHPASQTLEPRNNPRQLRTYGPGQCSSPARATPPGGIRLDRIRRVTSKPLPTASDDGPLPKALPRTAGQALQETVARDQG